jgi:hypothetical protein
MRHLNQRALNMVPNSRFIQRNTGGGEGFSSESFFPMFLSNIAQDMTFESCGNSRVSGWKPLQEHSTIEML